VTLTIHPKGVKDAGSTVLHRGRNDIVVNDYL